MEPAPDLILYTVTPLPAERALDVQLRFRARAGDNVLAIPAWIPGSYLLREFARGIGPVTARRAPRHDTSPGPGHQRAAPGHHAAPTSPAPTSPAPACPAPTPPGAETGDALPVHKIERGRWVVRCDQPGPVDVSWRVNAHELTVRTAHVDPSHAFFNGANALMYVEGREQALHLVRVRNPLDWQCFCPLERDDELSAWSAPDYDTLADTPFELGPHRWFGFDVLDTPHRIILWGDEHTNVDTDRLIRDTRAIIEHHARVFGGLPYPRYDIIIHIGADLRGGLEHHNGTTLATPWAWYESDAGHVELLGLIAHEHLHVWNGKRIRPHALGPFDYQRENDTSGLWVVEGFTSYLDDRAVLEAGLMSADVWLQRTGDAVNRLLHTPGRQQQSLVEAAFDAWIRLYRPDEDTPNRTVSYYLKGAVVALLLDLRVRSATGAGRTLYDGLTHLWRLYRARDRGWHHDEVLAAISSATGVACEAWLEPWLHGVGELPVAEALATHGLLLHESAGDGVTAGLVLQERAGQSPIVRTVLRDGPNHGGSVMPGDELVAINGRRAARRPVRDELQRHAPGDRVEVTLFRRDVLLTATLAVAAEPSSWSIRRDDNADPAAIALRDQLLREGAS